MRQNQLFLIILLLVFFPIETRQTYATFCQGSYHYTDLIEKINNQKEPLDSVKPDSIQLLLDKREFLKNTITLLTDKENIIPLLHLENLSIASLSIGKNQISTFQKTLEKYVPMDHYFLSNNAVLNDINHTLLELNNYDLIITGIHEPACTNNGETLTDEQLQAIKKLNYGKSIICYFGEPFGINFLEDQESAKSIILSYTDDNQAQELTAQIIFGAIKAKGKLPISINKIFRVNHGLGTKKINRLAYSMPEEVGISSSLLQHKMDSISNIGLKEKAYPGCQVLIAKNGNVIFHKCYGYQTYKNSDPVIQENLYDLASITKILGPLPAIMKLYDQNKIDIDLPFSTYWSDFKNSDKRNITFREILAHQGGLMSWLPFWQETIKNHGNFKAGIFKSKPSRKYCLRVSKNLYENKKFISDIYKEIKLSKLLPEKKYVYSDLTNYLYPQMISNLTGEDYEEYLLENFYSKLGTGTLRYNPYKYFPTKLIIPTENDYQFRKEIIQGFVHDEGAAMMGGVSGNAGLFSTANDLAKIMQMYLQYGYYGGTQFIDSTTIVEFTRRQYPDNENRRGLGFDKPFIDNNTNKLDEAYPAIDASINSFGHSGFTGTFAWADPDNQLLFIFLSNRVFPTRDNSKIYDLNIRPMMHQAIYDCVKIGTDKF